MQIRELFKIKHKINEYQDEIYKRNCRNIQAFALGGILVMAAILFVGSLLSHLTAFVFEYFIFLVYFIAVYGLVRLCIKKQVKHILAVYYICVTPVFLGGILLGTVLDPKQPAIIIMVLLCVLTLFIIDYPIRIFAVLIIVAVVFVFFSYNFKSIKIFQTDFWDIVTFLCISIGVNYLTLMDRVESAYNYTLVRKKSEIDSLTGLLNRGIGEKRMGDRLKKQIKGAFIIIDIDDFKQFNDDYGHQIGDEVICQVANALTETFLPTDVVWRLGGDEFAVFANDLVDEDICNMRLRKLKKSLKGIQTSYPEILDVGVSIGCTICHEPEIGFEQLYKLSDVALYEAKDQGKGRHVIYEI